MAVALSTETQRLIEERVKRGGYASADELVQAGLASLEQREAIGEFKPGEMDSLLEDGERSGPPVDGEQALAELAAMRARYGGSAK